MKVVDLTPGYIKNVIADDNFFKYENLYPELFEHYYKYWVERKPHNSVFKETELIRKRDIVVSSLKRLFPTLSKFDKSVLKLKLVMFVGDNLTNGHAFFDKDQVVVWIPIETYSTETDADVFLTHEIIHGLHYLYRPEFYFNDILDKNNTARLLITEGLATYLSLQLTSMSEREVLWADYLTQSKADKWMEECQNNWLLIKAFFRDNFSESELGKKSFIAGDPGDIFYYRCGYYAGMVLINELSTSEKLSSEQLLKMSRSELEDKIFNLL